MTLMTARRYLRLFEAFSVLVVKKKGRIKYYALKKVWESYLRKKLIGGEK